MESNTGIGSRWSDYRPSKALWFWSCAGCVVATMIVGFAWGGWVTNATATTMATDAAQKAKVQFAAAYCVSRFDAAPDVVTKLAALKGKDSWERGDFIQKGGWSTIPWEKTQIDGAAEVCARKLISAAATPSGKPAVSTSG